MQLRADDIKNDFNTWGNITAISSLGNISPEFEKIKLWTEAQGRFGDDSSRFSQGILRVGSGYSVNDSISLWLGYAWIPTTQPFSQSDTGEHRIWQQLLWNKTFEFGTVMSRTRLEQRNLGGQNDVGWRFRQFFKLTRPIAMAPSFSWVLWDEVFIDINKPDWKLDNGFDQNRVFAGVGYQFDSQTRFELGYVNQFIRKTAANDSMNHILSLNLFLKF